MKVAWFDAEKWEKEYLKDKDTGELEIEFIEEPLNEDTVEKADNCDAATVFVSSDVNTEVLETADFETLCCRSTGFDHVNLEAAEKEDIDVFNVPNYGATTVAEHTFGLILALSRKIYDAIEKVNSGEFDHAGLRGFDLEGKTLGVIGTGDIGQHVIKIARGFGMNVIASDPYPQDGLEEELEFMYVSMTDLLEKSDIVSLHAPLTDSTRHMISGEEFEKMEETVLINTSRGELLDTESLIQALEDDSVIAAGLDVLEEECYIDDDIKYLSHLEEKCDPKLILEDHILMDREDVLITPHNAFNSIEALQRIADTTVENLIHRSNPVN